MIAPSNMNHVIAESLGLLRHHNIYYSDLNTLQWSTFARSSTETVHRSAYTNLTEGFTALVSLVTYWIQTWPTVSANVISKMAAVPITAHCQMVKLPAPVKMVTFSMTIRKHV